MTRHLGIWVLFAVAPCVACAGTERSDAASAPITVMSFNLRFGTADDGDDSWAHRRDLVAEVIREQAPDIMGTQEALRFQLDELASALPEYTEIGVGRDDGGTGGEYAAILFRSARYEVAEQGTFWFSDSPERPGSVGWGAHLPRICTWARLRERDSGRAFYVYNVHFDHESQESREKSAALLLDRIRQRPTPDPVLVTGDFNAGEDNRAMLLLTGQVDSTPAVRLRDSFRIRRPEATDVGTFHGFRGGTGGPKIDAILVSSEWVVESASIVRTSRGGRYPSDHYPVVTTVRR
jgi:endonuclease/exonuclease/phosphatase family metal-dependent hydrolase